MKGSDIVFKTCDNIRRIREEKFKISQEKMAEKLNMSDSSYKRLERGERRLYLDELQHIANVLDVDIAELQGFYSNCKLQDANVHYTL